MEINEFKHIKAKHEIDNVYTISCKGLGMYLGVVSDISVIPYKGTVISKEALTEMNELHKYLKHENKREMRDS